ncbi:probable C-terminal domain small phosphatase [Selaginella moellendorffii]|uniref:probable C-terminal domain small phosphatase n=1 Tax=Selaginella moellendorffii TaxID=88036 RepID=UPI000D1CC2D9|nr:probable C-terminal domain small phosphatase [Selaginella moellendorffii]|eukprot:XP_024522923.1 probable C-terminal domain small phosphatase [Selaginella moellendorffii]
MASSHPTRSAPRARRQANPSSRHESHARLERHKPRPERPFVDDFLRQMARVYEIVVFTSCDRRIADPILDELDPEGRLFAHRLYTEHCSWSSEVGHVKDLSMLGRGMERVVIVDDSESKCVWNLDNWVPVSSFWDNPGDRELLDLVPFLLGLAKVEDVRPVVRKWRLQNFGK